MTYAVVGQFAARFTVGFGMIAMYLKPLELELQAENTHHQHTISSHANLSIVQAAGVHYFQTDFSMFFKGIHSNIDAHEPKGKRQGLYRPIFFCTGSRSFIELQAGGCLL